MILLGRPPSTSTPSIKDEFLQTTYSSASIIPTLSPKHIRILDIKQHTLHTYQPQIPILSKKTAKAFKKHGITIAEVGFWDNLQSLNEYERMKKR